MVLNFLKDLDIKLSTSSLFETSVEKKIISWDCFLSLISSFDCSSELVKDLEQSIKFAPSFRKALEISNPKPELAPVIKAVLFSKFFFWHFLKNTKQ